MLTSLPWKKQAIEKIKLILERFPIETFRKIQMCLNWMIGRVKDKKTRYEFMRLATGQVLAVGFSLIGVKIFTKYMPTSGYGQFSLLLTIQMASVQLIYGPIGNACLRFAANATTNHKRNKVLYMAVLIASAASGITLGTAFAMCSWTELERLYHFNSSIMMGVLYSTAFGLIHILCQYFNANRNRAAFSLMGAALSGCQMFFGLACIVLLGANLINLLFGYVLASFVVLAVGVLYGHKAYGLGLRDLYLSVARREYKRSRAVAARLCEYSAPFAKWGLFTMVFIGSDRWALWLTQGASSVGIYSVAYQLCYAPVAIIGGLIMQFITPILFQISQAPKDRRNRYQRNLRIIQGGLIICITSGIVISLISPYIIEVFTNSGYRGPSLLGPLLAMSAAISSSAEIFGLLYQENFKVGELAKIKILCTVLCIGSNFYFAKHWGPIGVSISLGAYGLTQIALMVRLYKGL